MSRCKACNDLLTLQELKKDYNGADGLCFSCVLMGYSVQEDTEYIGGVSGCDILDMFRAIEMYIENDN